MQILLRLAVLGLLAIPLQDAATIRRQVLDIFNFHPADLNAQERNDKSAAMDRFWDQAKTQPAAYLPVIRAMLQESATPSFFLFDGSELLLTLSPSADDRAIAAAAFSKCDLRDIDRTGYFAAVHRLSASETDSVAAALHVLDDPGFQVREPAHALTLGQDYALVSLLLPLDESRWVPALVKRLSTETNEKAQKSLLLALWYAQTREADDAVAAYARATENPAANRGYATSLMFRNAGVVANAPEFANLPAEAALRATRRARMRTAISDEALYDLDDLTRQIIARRKQ